MNWHWFTVKSDSLKIRQQETENYDTNILSFAGFNFEAETNSVKSRIGAYILKMKSTTQEERQVYNLFQWPVEQVHYVGGWVEGANPFGAKTLQTDKHTGLVAHKTVFTYLWFIWSTLRRWDNSAAIQELLSFLRIGTKHTLYFDGKKMDILRTVNSKTGKKNFSDIQIGIIRWFSFDVTTRARLFFFLQIFPLFRKWKHFILLESKGSANLLMLWSFLTNHWFISTFCWIISSGGF